MGQNVFLRERAHYQRKINPVEAYVEQMTVYLQAQTNTPPEECRAFILKAFKQKLFSKIQDPEVTYYEREDNGDRFIQRIPLSKYFRAVTENNEILAPSFTSYLHPSVKKSILSKYTFRNVKLRSKAKSEAFIAKNKNDMITFTFKNNEQKNRKLDNNALSGAFVASGSVLCNPTAHSTLTSTTRTGTSLVNASNERMISGNRHYWSPDVVVNNLIAVMTYSRLDEIEAAIEKYYLVYPSVDDVMSCITYSSDLYWRDTRALARIKKIVVTMTAAQRAAFVYSGNLYFIRKHNEDFMRQFIGKMSQRETASGETQDPKAMVKEIKAIDEPIVFSAHKICADLVKGLGKDYDQMAEKGVLPDLLATAKHIAATVTEYADFIQAFLVTDILPCSVAYVPDMIRRCAVLSDTDSSCFSVDEWVEWAFGEIVFNRESFAVAATVSYLAAQSVTHILAVFSANINVDDENLHTLAYKGEWIWPIMVPMNVAKHYFARAIFQEGNVLPKHELELKGVHLKSSNLPESISNGVIEFIEAQIDTLMNNEKLSMAKMLQHVIDLERHIEQSLLCGDLEFYRTNKIKEASAYSKDGDNSPYLFYKLWCEVFEPKYGPIEEPPYEVIKIPTKLTNATDLKNWLASIHDRGFADRMATWLAKHGKTNLPTLYLPVNFLLGYGMPEEVRPIIYTNKLILDLTNVYRIILESFGFYTKNGLLVQEMVVMNKAGQVV